MTKVAKGPRLSCDLKLRPQIMGVFRRPLTLILLQKYGDTNGSRIVIQIGGVYATFCPEKGIILQKCHDRGGRCIAVLFKGIRVRDRFCSHENLHLGAPTKITSCDVFHLLSFGVCKRFGRSQFQISLSGSLRNQNKTPDN